MEDLVGTVWNQTNILLFPQLMCDRILKSQMCHRATELTQNLLKIHEFCRNWLHLFHSVQAVNRSQPITKYISWTEMWSIFWNFIGGFVKCVTCDGYHKHTTAEL